MKFLVTGAAGFIGMHTSVRLLKEGHEVVGLDNLNSYYDPALKNYRLDILKEYDRFRFVKMDLADRDAIATLFKLEQFERVIHLAAQAGVRYSLESPFEYVDSNLVGMLTILEGCRHNRIQHLVYASSSSVYGMNKKVPFSETDNVDHPVSLYAATKKANELMAHTYSHLYRIPTTGLRFFTVYGPAGRPDMAPWLFTEAALQGRPIKVFNHGKMKRDFTYIDDIVEGIFKIQDTPPRREIENTPPYKVYNIGNNTPIELEKFIGAIEKACKRTVDKVYIDMQPGDVPITFADIDNLDRAINYKPDYPIEKGIQNFIDWYKDYTQNSGNIKQRT